MPQVDMFKLLYDLRERGTAFCTATIVDKRGSIPQVVGARAVFTAEGRIAGTVGGGRLELHCQTTADELLRTGRIERTRLRTWNLRKDIGMTCAGEATVFFEVNRPDFDWQIVVFGAGHVSQTLCRLLVELDCRVTCVDTRQDWLDRLPESAKLTRRLVDTYADGVGAIPDGATVIVMTKGHAFDVPILREIETAGIRPAYLGAIGSKSKAAVLRRDLIEAGASRRFVDSLVCPMGDKIGDNTPAEISFGIIAQILRLRTAEIAARTDRAASILTPQKEPT
ncbi:MAG: XdhC family protein [Rhodobacteraceae bacterium]|nr:XdhC family protein [Paracoccaceae bacterium]